MTHVTESGDYVICTACPRHCLLGILARVDGVVIAPKDYPEPIPGEIGIDVRPFCSENYVTNTN